MNKNELISAVAEATGVSKKDTDAVIKATFEAITKAMANGEKVQLIGFGTFETRARAERTGIRSGITSGIRSGRVSSPSVTLGDTMGWVGIAPGVGVASISALLAHPVSSAAVSISSAMSIQCFFIAIASSQLLCARRRWIIDGNIKLEKLRA